MSGKRPDANEVLQKLGADGLRRQLDTQRRPYLVQPANRSEAADTTGRRGRRKKQEWNWRDWSITAAVLQSKVFPEIAWVLRWLSAMYWILPSVAVTRGPMS